MLGGTKLNWSCSVKQKEKSKLYPVLDLHGVYYDDVIELVEKFVSDNDEPLKIITGHSEPMKQRVREVLRKYNLHDRPEKLTNVGCMIVSSHPWSP